MKNTIAFCGLDCEKCDAYLATINNDRELREKTAQLWSELNQVTITPEQINCEGCRKHGAKTYYCENLCGIRQCALKKEVETCGECIEMETCQLLETIVSNNPSALNNLKSQNS